MCFLKKGGILVEESKNWKRSMIYLVLFVLCLQFSVAEVVVFSKYVTTTTLEDDHLHISREIILQNVGGNPIIPGELHFKLHEIKDDKRIAANITDFHAWDEFDAELKTSMGDSPEETDLVVSIWDPVMPKFSKRIRLEYNILFRPKGLLFYELNVPVEETTIPIKNNINTILLPYKYKVTHAPDAEVKNIREDGKKYRSVRWKNQKHMLVEYSLIPLPRLGIRAVNLFWGVVIIATLAASLFLHKKMR